MSGEYVAVPAKAVNRMVFWIRRALVVSNAQAIELWTIVRTQEFRLTCIPVNGNTDPEELARELAALVEDDREAQRFRLVAMVGAEKVSDMVLPAKAGESVKGKPERLTQSESKDEFTNQLIRYTEGLTRLVLASQEERERANLATIERQSAQIAEMANREVEVARRYVDIIREDSAAKLAARTAEVRAQQIERVGNQLVTLLPKAVEGMGTYLATKNGLPPETIANLKHVGPLVNVIKNLTAEQVEAVSKFFPPEASKAILDAWESLVKPPAGAESAGDH